MLLFPDLEALESHDSVRNRKNKIESMCVQSHTHGWKKCLKYSECEYTFSPGEMLKKVLIKKYRLFSSTSVFQIFV